MTSDETTRIIRSRASHESVDQTKTIAQNKQGGISSSKVTINDGETKVFRPRSLDPSHISESSISKSSPSSFYRDPVVGWLVVISGPGKGISIELGYGVNKIGRESDQRVSLDFGDDEISRQAHAAIVYDPKSRRFFIQHGDGVNLTYVNEEPVIQSLPLSGNEVISIGNTRLMFIPLCGDGFEWT